MSSKYSHFSSTGFEIAAMVALTLLALKTGETDEEIQTSVDVALAKVGFDPHQRHEFTSRLMRCIAEER